MGARKMIKKLFILVTVLCLCLTAGVRAEAPEAAGEAAEVTSACSFRTNAKETDKNAFAFMTDRDVSTYFALKEKKGYLIIESSEPVCGVSVMLYNRY